MSESTAVVLIRSGLAAVLGLAATWAACEVASVPDVPDPPAVTAPRRCDDHAGCAAWRAKALECERWTP